METQKTLNSQSKVVLVVQLFNRVQLFATPWITVHQTSLSFTISWSLLKLISIESVIPSKHLILCRPISLLPSICPSIRAFSNESALGLVFPWCISVPQSWNRLPLPSRLQPSGLSKSIGFECPASCFKFALVVYVTYGNIHVSMLFSQIIPPLPSPTYFKCLFCMSVSLLLSCILGSSLLSF